MAETEIRFGDVDDCAVCPFRQTRGPCGPDCTPEPWTLDHQVHLFAQTESRPGPLTDEGERWMERQPTGKVMLICSCGYTSGLIDRAELESTVAQLQGEHTRRRRQEADAVPQLKTQQVTTHTITLTDAELAAWRDAARCALDLGGDKDEHTATWRTISRLGLGPTRGRGSSAPETSITSGSAWIDQMRDHESSRSEA